jgi:hypothetical protein
MNPVTAILIMLSLSVAAGDDARDKPATPEEQYKALVKDFYQAANLSFNATTGVLDTGRKERGKNLQEGGYNEPPKLATSGAAVCHVSDNSGI